MAGSGGVLRKVAVRGILAHKLRLALSLIAVMLGAGFVAGSFTFTDTLKATFNTIFSDSLKGVAVHIEPNGTGANGVPTDLLPKLRAVDGVDKVVPSVEGDLVLVGANNKPVQSGGAPSIGMAWTPPDQAIGGGVDLIAGKAPMSDDQVAINDKAANKAKLHVGDHTKVVTRSSGIVQVTVSGIYQISTDTGGFIGVFFPQSRALTLFSDSNHVFSVDISAKPGVSQTELKTRIDPLLPAGAEAKTADQVREDNKTDLDRLFSIFNDVLLAFAGISLIVGMFIIYNTFSMLMAQRLRELALLRAIGTTRRQVRRMVLIEATIVGLLGGALGLAVGAGLATGLYKLMDALDFGVPSRSLIVSTRTILVSLAIGLITTVLSSYIPARRAGRTPPVAAMRAEFASPNPRLWLRSSIGFVITAVGALSTIAGTSAKKVGPGMAGIGFGAFMIIIGSLFLSPLLAKWLIGLLGVLVKPFGTIGRLAQTNAIRNPRRTAATAFALTLGLMLVCAFSVIGESVKTSVAKLIDTNVKADLIVSGQGFLNIPDVAAQAMAKTDGVAGMVRSFSFEAKLSSEHGGNISEYDGNVAGHDGDVASVFSQKFLQGGASTDPHALLLADDIATDHSWSVGQNILMTNDSGQTFPLHVTGIFKHDALSDGIMVSGEAYRAFTPVDKRADDVDFLTAKSGTDVKALQNRILAITDPYYVLKVSTREEFKGQTASGIDSLLNLIYGLLGLAIVIAVLGIINTLALSVVERRREIGMLRAVGMVRGQLRRTIYVESALIAFFGALLGVVIGLTMGWSVIHLLGKNNFIKGVIPWTRTGLFLLVAVIVGVFAALWPAFRAARMKPLDAIAE